MNFKKGLALFLCLAIFLSGGAGMAFASVKISAKLISMEGDVQIIRAGGEKPFKAFVNMRLTEGDRIITGSNGTAKVQMEDDVIITLAENTRIYLSELRGSQGAQQSSINLQSGAVGSSVGKKLTDNSRFEIKTPTAVMGVRGTEFFTQYYNGNVDVRVVNGTVEVSVSVTETGGVAGPGATAVQTYTFPVAALQQVNFGEQTPLSQLQQPPQPLGLIGLPLPFLDRVQEINQQIPGAIPQDVINTIDQAVQSAIQTTQDRMSDPNLSPSELESFIEGVIAGNLEASLPSFAPPGMEIPPLPPQISPPLSGGGGGDSGGDDGGTTPQAEFFMHRQMEVEFHEDSDNQYDNYLNITLTFNRPVDASSLLDNPFTLQAIAAPITNGDYIASIGDEPNQVILSRVSYRDLPCELEEYIFVVTAHLGIRDTQGNSIKGTREAIYAADFLITTTSGDEFSQISPGTSIDIVNLYIEENEIHALIPGRTIELNLSENATWTTAPMAAVTAGDKITIGTGTIINDGETVQYTLAGTYSTNEVTITFSGGAIETLINPADKDVNVTFAGTSTGVEGTIKIAEIEAEGNITITSITPSTGLISEEETDFVVTVAYDFTGIDQAKLYIGFNDGENMELFNINDDASQIVTSPSGTHTFEVSSIVKDWGEDGDFRVYVNISESDHESSWTPLAFDQEILGIQSGGIPVFSDATFDFHYGDGINPTNIEYQSENGDDYIWFELSSEIQGISYSVTSSNEQCATAQILNEGSLYAAKLTISGTGTATITITGSAEGYQNFSRKINLTVTSENIAVSELSVDPTSASLIASGDTLTITPTITPVNATNQNVIWSSTEESVATVSNGVVTPIAAGSTYIEAKAEDNVEITAGAEIEVRAGVTATPIEQGATNPSTVIGLIGDTFTENAESIEYWAIDTGDTGLCVSHITIHENLGIATGATINFEGTRGAGTITIQPLDGALSSGIPGGDASF